MPEPKSGALRFPNAATPPGSSAYYSLRFGARERQPELALLLAWSREMRHIARDTSDPGIARLKLDWWREEIARATSGEARHPLTRELAPSIARHGLSATAFQEHIDAWEGLATGRRFRTRSQLLESCATAGGSLAELLTCVNGDVSGDHAPAARRLGASLYLAERIRDLGADLRRHRSLLPAELLQVRGLSEDALLASRDRDGLRQVLRELAQDCRQLHRETVGPGKRPALALGPVLILARLRLATLDEIEQAGFPVLAERVSLTPLRKLWISWRAGRTLR